MHTLLDIYTWPVPRPDFGRLWSWFVVICLQCPVFFPRRPLLPCHPAYAAPGQGVRPCPPRERSASTGADHPSSPLFSRLWWLFQFFPRRRKIPSETLAVTPPFAFWMSGARLQHGERERGEKRQSSLSQLVWVKSDLESCFRIKPLLLLPPKPRQQSPTLSKGCCNPV